METIILAKNQVMQEIVKELILLPEAYMFHILLIISTFRKELEQMKQISLSADPDGWSEQDWLDFMQEQEQRRTQFSTFDRENV